ncbi:MAG: DegT/DnrJ/EryC1/StrS family aminotransferase [Halothiobacillaceae bacterium]|nr:DegT/DnrJ/EryC1/StrS family aminotransferase [Halothiobacillaceae bacterium]
MYRGLLSARRENLPVAADMADRVICLPMYPALKLSDIGRVLGLIRNA